MTPDKRATLLTAFKWIVATGLLVVMAALFVLADRLDATHPAWGFVRSFAEAAMVGGLADWFAVTALFRHPLGIPIPHTAIIPRNKDRIGLLDTGVEPLQPIIDRGGIITIHGGRGGNDVVVDGQDPGHIVCGRVANADTSCRHGTMVAAYRASF